MSGPRRLGDDPRAEVGARAAAPSVESRSPGWKQLLDQLAALPAAATPGPYDEEELQRVRIMLRSGPPPHISDGVAWRLIATLDRAVRERDKLRAAAEVALNSGDTFRGREALRAALHREDGA